MAKGNGRKVYHIVPNASTERWVVSEENTELTKEFETKSEAEKFAKDHAREASFGHVKVHTRDGNMEYESTYGEDPERKPS